MTTPTKTAARTAKGGAKPTEPYTVEHNYHVPLEQEDGSILELVLPLRIGYRRMQKFMADAKGGAADQLEQLIAEFKVDDAALEGAIDYVDVLVGAQKYFEAFQDMAVARMGESGGSSAA